MRLPPRVRRREEDEEDDAVVVLRSREENMMMMVFCFYNFLAFVFVSFVSLYF